ncbi:unnamed protein product [Chrysoparadoxa australica]
MLQSLEGLEDCNDTDQQIAALQQLNMTLTMVSGHPSQIRLSSAISVLVSLLSSPSSEVTLLSVRALNTIIDIAPRAADAIQAEGALPMLCGHLLNITDIDVAEQCIKCLHLISSEAPRAVLDAGGMKACLAYFDFFAADLQQVALSTVAKLCAPGVSGSKEDVPQLLEVIPLLYNFMRGGSTKVTEGASLCFERLTTAFARPKPTYTPLAAAAADSSAASANATELAPWRASFLIEMSKCGVLRHWVHSLSPPQGGGFNTRAQARVLESLKVLASSTPTVLLMLYDDPTTLDSLRGLLLEQIRACSSGNSSSSSSSGGGSQGERLTEQEARMVKVLELAAALLPKPEPQHQPQPACKAKEGGSSGSSTKAKAKAKVKVEFQPAAVPQSWACEICTFINPSYQQGACEICSAPNPAPAPNSCLAAPCSSGDDLAASSGATYKERLTQFVEKLLTLLLQLELVQSSPDVDRLVLRQLQCLMDYGLYPGSSRAADTGAVLGKVLLSGDQQNKSLALKATLGLLQADSATYLPDLVRHGVTSQLMCMEGGEVKSVGDVTQFASALHELQEISGQLKQLPLKGNPQGMGIQLGRLADVLGSSNGVTAHELIESGAVPSLLKLLSAMEQNPEAASVFRETLLSGPNPKLEMLVSKVKESLRVVSAAELTLVRHGGASEADRYKALLQPFKVKLSAEAGVDNPEMRVLKGSFRFVSPVLLVEPVTTVGELCGYLQGQFHRSWRLYASASLSKGRAAAGNPSAVASSSSSSLAPAARGSKGATRSLPLRAAVAKSKPKHSVLDSSWKGEMVRAEEAFSSNTVGVSNTGNTSTRSGSSSSSSGGGGGVAARLRKRPRKCVHVAGSTGGSTDAPAPSSSGGKGRVRSKDAEGRRKTRHSHRSRGTNAYVCFRVPDQEQKLLWFRATIRSVHADGSMDLRMADGDERARVPSSFVSFSLPGWAQLWSPVATATAGSAANNTSLAARASARASASAGDAGDSDSTASASASASASSASLSVPARRSSAAFGASPLHRSSSLSPAIAQAAAQAAAAVATARSNSSQGSARARARAGHARLGGSANDFEELMLDLFTGRAAGRGRFPLASLDPSVASAGGKGAAAPGTRGTSSTTGASSGGTTGESFRQMLLKSMSAGVPVLRRAIKGMVDEDSPGMARQRFRLRVKPGSVSDTKAGARAESSSSAADRPDAEKEGTAEAAAAVAGGASTPAPASEPAGSGAVAVGHANRRLTRSSSARAMAHAEVKKKSKKKKKRKRDRDEEEAKDDCQAHVSSAAEAIIFPSTLPPAAAPASVAPAARAGLAGGLGRATAALASASGTRSQKQKRMTRSVRIKWRMRGTDGSTLDLWSLDQGTAVFEALQKMAATAAVGQEHWGGVLTLEFSPAGRVVPPQAKAGRASGAAAAAAAPAVKLLPLGTTALDVCLAREKALMQVNAKANAKANARDGPGEGQGQGRTSSGLLLSQLLGQLLSLLSMLQSTCLPEHVDLRRQCMAEDMSRKLLLQVMEPLPACAAAIPSWCTHLATQYPHLLQFEARMALFKRTSFDLSRAVAAVQAEAADVDQNTLCSSISGVLGTLDGTGEQRSPHLTGGRGVTLPQLLNQLGRLQRVTVSLSREQLLESAVALFHALVEGTTTSTAPAPEQGGRAGNGPATATATATAAPALSLALAASPVPPVYEDQEDDEDQDEDQDEEQDEDQDEDAGDSMSEDEEVAGIDGPSGDAAKAMSSSTRSQARQPHRNSNSSSRSAACPSMDPVLLVEFEGEIGHGTGPTQEFYTLCCRELQRRGLGLWRVDEDEGETPEAFVPRGSGLFPRPLRPGSSTAAGSGATAAAPAALAVGRYFLFMGRLIGKALKDGRCLDLPLALPLCKLLAGQHLLALEDLADVDMGLYCSMKHLAGQAKAYEEAVATNCKSKVARLQQEVDQLCLCWHLPGYPWYKLSDEKEADEAVTAQELGLYVTDVARHMLVDAIKPQLGQLIAGLSSVMKLEGLCLFTPQELQELLSGAGQGDSTYWTREAISNSVVCRHGYSKSSPQVLYLLETMTELTLPQRRDFLSFLTGTPRLPVGGFAALRPQLTIVKKETSGSPADYHLPSCSTCQVYLKLPAYSSKVILKEKLLTAIQEGQEYFALD